MSIVSNKMISKHYCPRCNSFDLLKLHRSFVQKRILGTKNKLQCRACGQVFKPVVFDQNIPIETPFFQASDIILVHKLTPEMVKRSSGTVVEQEEAPDFLINDFGVKEYSQQVLHHPDINEDHFGDSTLRDDYAGTPVIPEILDDHLQVVTVLGDEFEYPQSLDDSAGIDQMQMPDDDFKAIEAVLPMVDEKAPESNSFDFEEVSTLHSRDAHLVGDTTLLKEKKVFWPYVLGPLVVMFGAAYAFILMPITLNNGESDKILMDMSIGEPARLMAVKQADLLTVNKFGAEPSVEVMQSKTQDSKVKLDESLKADVDEAVKTRFHLAGVNSKKVKGDKDVIDLTSVKKPLATVIKTVVGKPKVLSLTSTNPELVSDSGRKSNVVSSDFSSNSRSNKALVANLSKAKMDVVPAKVVRPVNVPLPATPVRQFIVVKSDQKNSETLDIVGTDTTVSEAEKNENVVVKTVGRSPPKPTIKVRSTQVAAVKSGSDKKLINQQTKISSDSFKQESKIPKAMVFNKKAAILGISTQDLTALTGIAKTKLVNPVKSTVVKNQKEQPSDPNTRLLEKVSVKLIQQDLDKLFPN